MSSIGMSGTIELDEASDNRQATRQSRRKLSGETSASTDASVRKLKLKLYVAVFLFAASGLLTLWWSYIELVPPLQDAAAGNSVVELRPKYIALIPLASAFLALATMEMMPAPKPIKGRRRQPTHSKAQEFLFGAALIFALITLPSGVVGHIVVSEVMTARDYRRCPVSTWRDPPMRWVRTHLPCPQ
jgi:hypothetical protein